MRNVASVLAAGMCTGCGLCVEDASQMRIDGQGFSRPIRFLDRLSINEACPGNRVLNHNKETKYNSTWGPIVEIYAGHATDSQIRKMGSSGGVISALLLYLLTENLVDEVIQVGTSETDPIRNQTYLHAEKNLILKNAGSRYSPSSPLSVINSILGNGKSYAFVGKPCDVTALRTLLAAQPQFKSQFPILLSFMCAGVSSENGTIEIIKKMKIERENLLSFRYRGDGWPGLTKAVSQSGQEASLTYNESWGRILNRHLQARCKLCADGTGEAADIVCGDAWYHSENGYPLFEEENGRSLLVARTKIGHELINKATLANQIKIQDFSIVELEKIQPYQATRKNTALARILAIRLTFGQAPKFKNSALFRAALRAGFRANILAFLGTLHRRIAGRI